MDRPWTPSRHSPSLFGGSICKCYDRGDYDDDQGEKNVYEKNRVLFLLQSCLLGSLEIIISFLQ